MHDTLVKMKDGRIVSKRRMLTILKDCVREDRFFVCHKSADGAEVMCRGHYDEVVKEKMPPPQMLRIAERLRYVSFVDPEKVKL